MDMTYMGKRNAYTGVSTCDAGHTLPEGCPAAICGDCARARGEYVGTYEGHEEHTMNKTTTTPTVGTGATILRYSDRNACTIIAVSKSGKTITLQRDKATLLNGPNSKEPDALHSAPGGFCAVVSGVQRWKYEADPTAPELKATLRKDGHYHLVGASIRAERVDIGERYEHYDYNF